MQQLPVLIVGAGPTGLTAALELQRMGVPVRLVERAAAPARTSRAIAIQARTVELFAQRGLAEPMLALGTRVQGARLHSGGRQIAHVDLSRIPSRYNFALMLPQDQTERLLREHLQAAGVRVEFSTELVGFAQSGEEDKAGKVTALLRRNDGQGNDGRGNDGQGKDTRVEEFDAAYLVCAEGAHSTVRHTLALPFPGKSLEATYALADLYAEGGIPDDELTIFLAKNGLLAAFPMGDRRFRIIASDPAQAVDHAPAPTLEEMQAAWDTVSEVPVRLHDMEWSSRFRINSRVVDRLRQGRIFLAGDSAHVHSPVGGQGMNTGMQDCINLGWKLAMVYHGTAHPALLDTYGAERLPVIRGVVRTTETATDALQSHNPVLHQLLVHAAPLALAFDTVQDKATEMLSQTGATYAGGPLTEGAFTHGLLRPGDRLPDWQIGRGRWVHPLLDPSRFTLLVFGDGVDETLMERLPAGVAVQAVGAAPEGLFGKDVLLALVRPDGYLAMAVRAHETPSMERWMGRWLSHVADSPLRKR